MNDPWSTNPKLSLPTKAPVGFHGFSVAIPSTTAVQVTNDYSAAEIAATNLTGVDVLLQFGDSENPKATGAASGGIAEYGQMLLPAGATLNIRRPHICLSISKLTAIDPEGLLASAVDPRVVINMLNAYVTP